VGHDKAPTQRAIGYTVRGWYRLSRWCPNCVSSFESEPPLVSQPASLPLLLSGNALLPPEVSQVLLST